MAAQGTGRADASERGWRRRSWRSARRCRRRSPSARPARRARRWRARAPCIRARPGTRVQRSSVAQPLARPLRPPRRAMPHAPSPGTAAQPAAAGLCRVARRARPRRARWQVAPFAGAQRARRGHTQMTCSQIPGCGWRRQREARGSMRLRPCGSCPAQVRPWQSTRGIVGTYHALVCSCSRLLDFCMRECSQACCAWRPPALACACAKHHLCVQCLDGTCSEVALVWVQLGGVLRLSSVAAFAARAG